MTRNFWRKVRGIGPLPGIIAMGVALAACGSSNQTGVAANGDTGAVAASGSGVTVDVLTTSAPWNGGFPAAVRLSNTAFASAITSFEVVFKLASGSLAGTAWNGTITGPDASGNYTATNPSWIQPIQRGQTWDVGFNGSGTFTSSTIVSLKVNGQVIPLGGTTDAAPTVSLASSAATVTAAGSITLTATATDDVGVARVEFYEGTTLLASDTTAPYTTSIAFTAANNGAHAYTARAYDTAGQTGTSAAVTVTVDIGTADAPPTVSLASSAATVTAAGSITLTATATDDVGVARVEFYEGTTLLASDTTAPYTTSIAFTAANNGAHAYTARAYDTAGQTATSAAVTVTVNIGTSSGTTVSVNAGGSASGTFVADQYFTGGTAYTRTATVDLSQITSNPPPAAIFNSERYGAFTYTIPGFTAGAAATVTLYFAEGYVSAAGQRIFSVQINGTTVLSNFDIFASAGGRNRAIARTFSATANASGQVVLRFVAGTQNPKVDGITVTSTGSTTDDPPSVALASSATSVTTASTVTLTATATDDRGVSRVEFYEGTALLGSDTTAPYTLAIPFTSANNGSHTYTARAYDTAGQTATSAGVTVAVNIGTTVDLPPTVSLASSATTVTTATTITLTATATDDKGVTQIDFLEGTRLLGTVTESPSTLAITLTAADNGTHTYTARAWDTANQSATSSPVSVVVNVGTTPGSFEIDPPDVCYAQYWNQGCETGACGGRCQTANACSPPESPQKSTFPKTFACPRFIAFSEEMVAAAKADWGDSPPFVYGVVGHDADTGGLDTGTSTCCQCYQLVFDKPEGGSPQPPELPIPPPMIVQSFNTAAGGGKNFDIYMGAGGFGAFNACIPGTYNGTATTTFGEFMYTAFPSEYPTTGGIKAINIPECKVNGTVTAASMQSTACQGKIAQLCNNTASGSAKMTATTKASCIQTNAFNAFYHQNWQVRVKRVECPVALTRVTGCRLAPQGLPAANPNAKTPATADGTFRTGYTTTTMQDCCKPSCAWKDQVTGAGLQAVDKWTSFYSCDASGEPITAP